MARDTPMLWVRNQVLPESGISATLMKALMNEACSEPSLQVARHGEPDPGAGGDPVDRGDRGDGHLDQRPDHRVEAITDHAGQIGVPAS